MPDRIVRDEILASERWLGLADNGNRLAFLALLLTADSLGNTEAGAVRLYRLWRDFDITRDQVNEVLADLNTHDLTRPYEHDGKRYLHIPRFRQTTRFCKRLHPLSPWTTDAQKQALAKNSHGELPEGTMIAPSAHSEPVCRSDVDVDVEVMKIKPSRANGALGAHFAEGFEAFWSVYPKKRSKGDAEKVWAQLKPSSELAERILSALTHAKTSPDWTKNSGQYVPHPGKWLRAKGWEDAFTDGDLPRDLL